MEKKIYEQNAQWVRERRKYPNEGTFAARKLVLVYHSLGAIGQNPFNKMESYGVRLSETSFSLLGAI